MLAVAAQIPDAVARDQFADRIAHKARITEEVVRAEIRKAAVARKTTVTERELPSRRAGKTRRKRPDLGDLFTARRRRTPALAELEPPDLDQLAGREVFEVARSLHECAAGTITFGASAASKYNERSARHLASRERARHLSPVPMI